MVIDFHTHIFPDKIADRTISLLSAKGGICPFSDGKESGLISKMEDAGVDVAIALPVLTSPSQFESVLTYAAAINDKYKDEKRRIISFAGIHPDSPDIDGEMKRVADMGFLGVKIHPDYQGTFIDDERYVRILERAKEYGLTVVTHAGTDIAFRGQEVRCTPKRAVNLIRQVPYSRIVFAHLGGAEMAEEVITTLAGEDVYFDTSYVLRDTDRDTFMRILDRHGKDRMLFGSDSPWSDIKGDVEIIKSFSLKKDEEERIFSRNVRELLGI